MSSSFFRTYALFWIFWANILFILGMVSYLLMDGLDFLRPKTFTPSLSAIIYVILAGIFVVNSVFQLLSVYHTSSSTPQYYTLLFASIFDHFGSDAYLIGALLTAAALTNSKMIWTFNTIGVFGFATGAIINMMIRGPTILYSWANNLNLLGALLYVLCVFITQSPFTEIIIILGDFVYLIDAILFTICWFTDRQLVIGQGEQIVLVHR